MVVLHLCTGHLRIVGYLTHLILSHVPKNIFDNVNMARLRIPKDELNNLIEKIIMSIDN